MNARFIGADILGIMPILNAVAGKADCIDSGFITSVIVHQDQVYAADGINNQTEVFKQHETSREWLRQRAIRHDFEQTGHILTLNISNNQLRCCSRVTDAVKVYSLSGELLRTYVARGRRGAGRSKNRYVCDDDDDGSVLIAEEGNDRLQVMSEQGEFSVLKLQPPVSGPSSAVLFNNQLYVTSRNDTIYKYSC